MALAVILWPHTTMLRAVKARPRHVLETGRFEPHRADAGVGDQWGTKCSSSDQHPTREPWGRDDEAR